MWEAGARLQVDTLDGKYLTCPMHCAQFDVISGEAISGPVPADFGNETPTPILAEYLKNIGLLMQHVHTESIRTYTTIIISGLIQIAL